MGVAHEDHAPRLTARYVGRTRSQRWVSTRPLSDATVRCPTCGEPLGSAWRFQFGAVSDLPTYRIGDAIRWGARWFGQPAMSLVYA